MTVVIVGSPACNKSRFAEDMRDVMDQYGYDTVLVHDNWPHRRDIPQDLSRDTAHIYIVTERENIIKIRERELECCGV